MFIFSQQFTTVNNSKVCYKISGNGPYFFLLHPSPRTSNTMLPLMELLYKKFTVVAVDTPGYGLSQCLPIENPQMNDYVNFFEEFINQFTKEPIYIYGTATGAQISVAFANANPQKVKHLFIDNIAHFTVDERKEITENYFIDITPKADGSHLLNLWNHVALSTQFFPWYKQIEKNKISQNLAAANIIQAIVNDYLIAGINYAQAYKAAFNNEKKENIDLLAIPTIIFEWQGSPLLPYMQRITKSKLKDNIKVYETPKDSGDRFDAMQKIMVSC